MKPAFDLLIYVLLPLALMVNNSWATDLNDVEQKITAHITHDQNEARALLKKIVNINSGTMNFAGVKKVADVFVKPFAQLGFKTQWIDGKPFKRAGHFVAERLGDKNAPKILMIGHLDTVFSKDSAIQTYIEVDQQYVKGPGIIDMKGGDVIMLYALKALKQAGVLDTVSIRVVMTGDEEKRGRPLDKATKALTDGAKWADIALGFENGDGDPKTAVVSRRGYTGWQLTVTAKAAHSSQIFSADVGYGAIYESARILAGFRAKLEGQPNLTFNPGLIVGGTDAELDASAATATGYGKQNVIARHTRVSGDLRALTPAQQQNAQQIMQQVVAGHLAHTQSAITFEPGYPPMAPSPGNMKLLSLYSQASIDLGFGKVDPVDPRKAGAADISFAAAQVDMAIDGLGLMGHSGHTDHETAAIDTLSSQTKRSAVLLYRLGTTTWKK